jgi:prevent-host-death family protein
VASIGSTSTALHPADPLEKSDPGFAVLGRSVGIRALARNVSGVVDEVVASGLPVVLTKHGRPIAAIVPIDAVPAP